MTQQRPEDPPGPPPGRQESKKTSSIWSSFAVILLAMGMFQLKSWHGEQKRLSSKRVSAPPPPTRKLEEKKQNVVFDDDITRDDTCRDYLRQFLNGTTDAKDECQAMYRAWQLADCQDHQKKDLNPSSILVKSSTKNATVVVVDDDATFLIDDAYEKFDCCNSITDFYSKHCSQEKSIDALRLLGVVAVLIVCFWTHAILNYYKKWNWIPHAGASIVVGALVGMVVRLVDNSDYETATLAFDNDLFLDILLPPIIFEAALSIDKRAFRRDLFPILFYAIIGTALSAIAIAYITFGLTSLTSTNLDFLDSLLFGALMSSIDPVATLGILSKVGVHPSDTLYTLIFGESLLNDGVSIVLFDSLVEHAAGNDTIVDSGTISTILQHFVAVTVGSIVIGAISAAAATLYFEIVHHETAVTQVAVFFCWALVPYYIADASGHFSGIIAIMVMGFGMDYYVLGSSNGAAAASEEGEWEDYIANGCRSTTEQQQLASGYVMLGAARQQQPSANLNPFTAASSLLPAEQQQPHPPLSLQQRIRICLSRAFSGKKAGGHLLPQSRHHVGFCARVISTLMETAIFAYLGLFLWNDWGKWHNKGFFTLIGVLSCVASRAVMVIGLSLLINLGVLVDLEGLLGRVCSWCCGGISGARRRRRRRRRAMMSTRSNSATVGLLDSRANSRDDDDDDSDAGGGRSFLNCKTQLILFSAGVRGAVSYALVQNIPVYDVVTKHGSQFKGELRSMTSATIVILLFALGALTYFTVQSDDENLTSSSLRRRDHQDDDFVAGSSLTHRRFLSPLDSTVGMGSFLFGAQSQQQGGGLLNDEFLTAEANSLTLEYEQQTMEQPNTTTAPTVTVTTTSSSLSSAVSSPPRSL